MSFTAPITARTTTAARARAAFCAQLETPAIETAQYVPGAEAQYEVRPTLDAKDAKLAKAQADLAKLAARRATGCPFICDKKGVWHPVHRLVFHCSQLVGAERAAAALAAGVAHVLGDAEKVRARLLMDFDEIARPKGRAVAGAYLVHTLAELGGYCAIYAHNAKYAALYASLVRSTVVLRETMTNVGLGSAEGWFGMARAPAAAEPAPDTAKPDTAKPDTAKPDTAKPDTAKAKK